MTDVRDHIAKENIVRQYIKDFSIDIFIETGTYEGMMVAAIAPYVKHVYSIELDEELFEVAKENLKDISNIHLIKGNSIEILPEILSNTIAINAEKEQCLFWLDAHYFSGITAKDEKKTPILEELDAILKSPCTKVILIDDIRLFGKDEWPELQEIKETVDKVHPDWSFEVKDDIARICPKRDFISMSTLGGYKTVNGSYGNELFQYAALKIYAKKHGLDVEVPDKWIGRDLFEGCDDLTISQKPRHLKKCKSDCIWLNGEVLGNYDIEGYFQYHTSLYAPHKEYIKNLFTPKGELQNMGNEFIEKLRSPLIGIHIRRGDYSRPPNRVAPTEWYIDWLEKNLNRFDNPGIFIASDEIKTVLSEFEKYSPIACDTGMDGMNMFLDHYVLQYCDILLNSNSTFSFTAAMLNEKGKEFYRPDYQKKTLVSFDPWDSEPITPFPHHTKALRLNLGCGGICLPGYVNIDCKKTKQTDLVCDIRQLPLRNDTVDTIECYHVFEHMSVCLHANVDNRFGEKYTSLITILQEWRRVLKKGGNLVIEMPDLDGVIKEYLTADEKRRDELLIAIYGSYRSQDDMDIHKWGANEHRLSYMLEKAGFRYIKFCEAQDYHKDSIPCLRVEAIK